MSRLIIKNLPNKITSEKLKEHFSTQGEVTDVQLKYTSSGKFRHFGFIGFKTPEEAERAANYFNNTFINHSKVIVEHCAELGDASKPKAWSKYAPDSSAYKKIHSSEDKVKPLSDIEPAVEEKKKGKKEKVDPLIAEKLKKHKDDPMFLEFMEVHTKKAGTLGSDALKLLTEDQDSGVEEEASDDDEVKKEEEVVEKKSSAFAAISDLEYLKLKKKLSKSEKEKEDITEKKPELKPVEEKEDSKLFTVKITNLAFKTKKKEVKDFFRPLKAVGIRLPPKSAGFAYISFKSSKEMKKALNKNKSFLKGKQIGVKEYCEKDEDNQNVSETKNEKQKRWREQEAALMQEESIAESGSIFVRNLAYTVTEEELTEKFTAFGPLADVTMPVDRESRKMKGFATVTFVLPEHAVAAYTKLDGSVFHGRMLHLLPAKTKHAPDKEEDDKKSFKDKKKEKQKASAGQSHNWNTLFLGQNAVVDVMTDKHKLSKQELLTDSAAAVRLALAETHIVSDTREFLESNGVSLDAFNQAPKARSKTVILVKNLPANTTATEIREIFCKFGELGRIVLPPTGVTAIVEFLEPSEAKKAFLSLAYTRFKNLPLYLEWAPDDTFSGKGSKVNTDLKEEEDGHEQKQHEKEKENEDEGDLEPEPNTILFVKNLNFDTTEDNFKEHFKPCGRVASVTIARKRDPARPGQLLSMGFGFVQMTRQAEVSLALKTLQHSTLDGHQLELKRSNRTVQDSLDVTRKKNNVQKQTGTKILVRNIPFQTTQKEVTQLFEAFGQLKAIRLPRKMVGTGPHRGFAFVEFVTKHDAKRAMQALCQSTHLFGRRLVLEWAQQEETVEQLRKRTAESFCPEKPQRSKKGRADFEIENNEDDE